MWATRESLALNIEVVWLTSASSGIVLSWSVVYGTLSEGKMGVDEKWQ